ncbi:MAG: amidase [Vibrio sp.]
MDTRIFCQQGPMHLAPTNTGRLSGYRFVFKDLFDVAGYVTGAGNPQWLATHEPAQVTSPLIDTLLAHGAECVGRVQTDELAYSLNGQNIHYGTPVNPAAPQCIPGGSSSGSAVAVASDLADFALGTDTGGSVRVPASYTGLYGLRPTHGLLSLEAAFELAGRFDTAGILAKRLDILNTVFDSLHPVNEAPSVSHDSLYLDEAFIELLGTERLQRLQAWCNAAGVSLTRGTVCSHSEWSPQRLSELFRIIQGYDIIQNHGAWLHQHGRSLDPAIFARVEWARQVTSAQYYQALQQCHAFGQWLRDAMHSSGSHWVLPTTPGGPPSLTSQEEALAIYRTQLMGLTAYAGLAGLPQLHLPMSQLELGPAGISLLGASHQDKQLLAMAMKLQSGGSNDK